jgi:CheY-like chemotaxis protein
MSPNDRRRTKIMVVDDDPIVLETARERLEGAGYEVSLRAVAFGTTAAVLREKPDFLLLDVDMPGLRGDAIAEVLAGCSPGVERPEMILHSSSSKETLLALAGRCGAIGVIEKTGDSRRFLLDLAGCISTADASRGAV